MTERDFYNKVIAHEGIPSDIKEYAMEGIAKLDAKNLKRKNTPTKEQVANEGLKTDILALLGGFRHRCLSWCVNPKGFGTLSVAR